MTMWVGAGVWINITYTMLKYSRHTLPNGLRVLLHSDTTTPLVTLNLLYQVGSRDESPARTGFAHLFEHLMFGGTQRYPDFDRVVDSLAGESNALTNNDYTDYYMTLPAEGLDTALALEADRMWGYRRGLDSGGTPTQQQRKSLEVQKKVVTEEYHQRYLNQPYGDVWMLLRPLCYRRHPYRWCPIGADIRHVQEATHDEVHDFFDRYYTPDNAILSIAGNIDDAAALQLVQQHFAAIPPARSPLPPPARRHYPPEPALRKPRHLSVVRDVPNAAFYMAWVMPSRHHRHFYACDALSDVLSTGHSSVLYQRMVQDEALLTEVNAYITGDLDRGLFVVQGKLRPGVDFARPEAIVREEIDKLSAHPVAAHELEKVANRYENTFLFSQYRPSDRAMALCYYEMLGDVALINHEPDHYRRLTPQALQEAAARYLAPHKCCTLEILTPSHA